MNARAQVRSSSVRPTSGLCRTIRRVSHYVPLTVSDDGDDHEMGQDFGNSLTRAGDRIAGFAFGAGILAAAWAAWLLI